MAAARPVAGAPVDTTWGQQAHDTAVEAKGCAASGATTTSLTGNLPLGVFMDGIASWLNAAGNEIVVPVAGLYEIKCALYATGLTAGAAYRAEFLKNAGNLSFGVAWPSGGGSVARGNASITVPLAAGDRISMGSHSAMGGSGTITWQIQRLSVRLLAQGWAAA